MANIITTVFKAVDKELDGSLKKIRKEVDQTDGRMKKFGTGAKTSMAEFKGAAVAGTAVAGAAFAAFGVKAVQAFTDTALAAGQFADTTGLSLDASSRWLDVTSRFGIELNDLSDAFNNVAEKATEGDEVFEQFNIAIEKTAAGTVDMNATMIGAVETIQRIQDPAAKATAMVKLFGEEGARQFSEMTAQGYDLREAMDAVADSRIIDTEELEKAREAREDMKRLQDTVSELSMEVGESLLPALDLLATSLSGINQIIGALKIDVILDGITDIEGKSEALGRKLRGIFDESSAARHAYVAEMEEARDIAAEFDSTLFDSASTFDDVKRLAEEYTSAIEDQDVAHEAWLAIVAEGNKELRARMEAEEAAERAAIQAMGTGLDHLDQLEKSVGASKAAALQTRRLSGDYDDLADALTTTERAHDRLRRELDKRDAYLNALDAVDDLAKGFADLEEAEEDESLTAEQVARKREQLLIDAKRDLLDYIEELGNVPGHVTTQVNAAIDAGDVAEIERILAEVTRQRRLQIGIETIVVSDPNQVIGPGQIGIRHTGGRTQPGTPYQTLAGEVFVPDGPGQVLPREAVGNGSGGDFKFEAHFHGNVTNVDDVNAALEKWARQVSDQIRRGRA